ncbi:sulfotransferase family 2 domain-containing protein [Paenibacillus harenae]|uniref:sulfotransferase family 2 domain-containing protein n=1 Tax=Paenibacillus harenae TaxID=306543 RepID=UPI00278F0BFC|nr:sulfotransferase family 2 domain-containing protein [Paenibacillus harenae]MDQ0058841.1 hypothetical protein [Paenibacillus harenae]
MNANEKFLIYMHIPKTGGTTLSNIIDKNYSKTILYIHVHHKIKLLEKENLNGVGAFMGHYPYGTHQYIPKPCVYISMMRDPIECIISLYYYILAEKLRYWHDKVKTMSFDEFLEDSEYDIETSNMQTRYFCGGHTLDIGLAKKNLEKKFLVVGINEQYNDSLKVMQRELGWKDISYSRAMVNAKRPLRKNVPDSIINKIIEKNKLDIELYHFAKSLLNEKLEKM